MNNNTLRQQIKQQHQLILKEQGFKAWFHYFLDYYKWQIILCLGILFFIILFIVSMATKKDTVLQIAMINSSLNQPEEIFMNDFTSFAHLNPKKETVFLDSSLYVDYSSTAVADRQTSERLYIMSSAGAIDVLLSDGSYFPHIADEGYLLDLRTIFSEEELQSLGNRVFYHNSPHDNQNESIPVGIDVTNSRRLQQGNCYPATKAYFSVSISSEATDYAKLFYQYLIEE